MSIIQNTINIDVPWATPQTWERYWMNQGNWRTLCQWIQTTSHYDEAWECWVNEAHLDVIEQEISSHPWTMHEHNDQGKGWLYALIVRNARAGLIQKVLAQCPHWWQPVLTTPSPFAWTFLTPEIAHVLAQTAWAHRVEWQACLAPSLSVYSPAVQRVWQHWKKEPSLSASQRLYEEVHDFLTNNEVVKQSTF